MLIEIKNFWDIVINPYKMLGWNPIKLGFTICNSF